ncbi:MAG: sodium/proline symporter [Candidatus Thalassarchaeum sp.]|jgi:sodium/proline symporter|nr:sodium/proline symporter [Candidatus Thalassarchaeum sp.]MCH2646539.1 sodium/proline symporter [Candidatus Thalassarchaeum sp.]
MDLVLVASFLLFMCAFAGIGLASMWVKEDTTDDYLVAGRGMHPALAALSAVSTWNSGYMFIGFIGFTYTMGYSIIWIGLGSMIGQIVAWVWLYKFIQQSAKERDVRSLSSLVSNVTGSPEAKLAAVLSVLFLAVYAAAQLTSGGKALYVMLGWSEVIGILIGFVLVVAYCYAGGIRASIWTDAAQSSVMIIGSSLLCYVAMQEVGGISGLHEGLESQNANLTSMVPADLNFGVSLWIFAFFLGGLSVAGQPQVVTRVMTLATDQDRKTAMLWFFAWQTPFLLIMVIIGLASRVVFTGADFDPELGLPMLAMETLGPFWVGLILASIFAATMSTADSQVLACTAAFTDDVMPQISQDHKKTKIVTLVIAAFATAISIFGLYVPGGDSVFALVVLAVYGLGSIFVPILIIRWAGYEPDTNHTMAMMLAALFTVILWSVSGFGDDIFPSVPGMGAAFITHFVMNQLRSSDISPLGRFDLPDFKTIGIGALVILAPVTVVEASYIFAGPDSLESDGGPSGDWLVEASFGSEQLADGIDYVNDGQTLTVEMHTDAIDDSEDLNIVGVRVTLTYSEDETSSGLGCNAPGASNPDPDTITGTVVHNEHNTSASGQNSGTGVSSHIVEVEWFNASMIGNVSGVSKSDINNGLDVGDAGLGVYTLDVTVVVDSGGGLGCSHTDDGEEVEYLVELITLDYSITSA